MRKINPRLPKSVVKIVTLTGLTVTVLGINGLDGGTVCALLSAIPVCYLIVY